MIPLITPAILTDKFNEFSEQLKKVHNHFSSVQIDVMDGVFVDNKSFSEREALNDMESEAYFELHLMVQNPLEELHTWANVANVSSVIFHIESNVEPLECIKSIRANNWRVGIALNPETSVKDVLPYLDLVDEIVCMTIHPGRQGAELVPEALDKIAELKKIKNNITISADGAINEQTIQSVVQAGADKLYVGSAIIKSDDVEAEHEKLVQAIGEITI